MGQWLSLPMIVAGIVMMLWAYRRAGKQRADADRPDEGLGSNPALMGQSSRR